MSLKTSLILFALSAAIVSASWNQWNFVRRGPLVYLEPDLNKQWDVQTGYKAKGYNPISVNPIYEYSRGHRNDDAKLAMNWDLDYLRKLDEYGRRRKRSS